MGHHNSIHVVWSTLGIIVNISFQYLFLRCQQEEPGREEQMKIRPQSAGSFQKEFVTSLYTAVTLSAWWLLHSERLWGNFFRNTSPQNQKGISCLLLSQWLVRVNALVSSCPCPLQGKCEGNYKKKKKTEIWEEGTHLTALKCDVSNETFKSGKRSWHSEVLQAVFHSSSQKSLRREGFQSLHGFENTHKCNKEIFLSKRTSRKTQGILAGG